jgi:hypothetical protein
VIQIEFAVSDFRGVIYLKTLPFVKNHTIAHLQHGSEGSQCSVCMGASLGFRQDSTEARDFFLPLIQTFRSVLVSHDFCADVHYGKEITCSTRI